MTTDVRKEWAGPAGVTLFWLIGLALVGFIGWGAFYVGTGWATQVTLSSRMGADEQATEQSISSARHDAAEATSNLGRVLTDRMDHTDQDLLRNRAALDLRLKQDESDTKSAAQVVNSVDLRLTRMEAQLDLVVKNITTAGARR